MQSLPTGRACPLPVKQYVGPVTRDIVQVNTRDVFIVEAMPVARSRMPYHRRVVTEAAGAEMVYNACQIEYRRCLLRRVMWQNPTDMKEIQSFQIEGHPVSKLLCSRTAERPAETIVGSTLT
eukprot:TRINITY_DN18291_c0_g1_i1.p3 TRINITY_DN18291_c0_g1~~TRINITY_DN18291_c0_g1_i1.p3  ORF type:complete len:122 (-),score=7.77 TRINITY_DN18291_c0_g1_i1:614-979(-)